MDAIFLGKGSVYHSRKGSIQNSFRYPIYYLYFNCEQEMEVQRLFSRGWWRIFSLSPKDYLKGEPPLFNQGIKDFLQQHCHYHAEEVWLQTLPRLFKYAFNPVSFWFCRRNGELDALLVEVHNTFGERHFYWIPPSAALKNNEWIRAEKVFHVSPFYPVSGHYRFRIHLNSKISDVKIYYYDEHDSLALATGLHVDFQNINDIHPLGLLLKYGWMTPLVILRIHFQALKLWFKKAKFYSKPEPPEQDVSL